MGAGRTDSGPPRISRRRLSVRGDAVRFTLAPLTGDPMKYALLVQSPAEEADRTARPIPGTLAALLDRPDVTGWARLHADESATTVRHDGTGGALLTDGPFIDSKEYLAGLI